MPNPNAIVSMTIRLDPPLDRASDELLRQGPIEVQFEGDRRARLDPGDVRAAGFASILDRLAKQGLPVYVEIDPGTGAIMRLLVPHVGRVVGISGTERHLDIELDRSHGRHVLMLGEPDSSQLERELRKALQSGASVVLTEDDRHNIIDVRTFTPAPDGPVPPLPPTPKPGPRRPMPGPFQWVRRVLDRIRLLAWWPCWWFRCPSAATVNQAFASVAAATCDPLTTPAPCIPFLYPDDGCWARAHEMCRLMIATGLSPRKVWIDRSSGHWLHVSTRNHPNCYVEWGWHVAPTLCVRGSWIFFWTRRMVIDPSLFTTPVTVATWKGVQGDPGATLTHTGAEQFWHGGGTDPTYTASNSILAQYRTALQTRALQAGPPPYANCP